VQGRTDVGWTSRRPWGSKREPDPLPSLAVVIDYLRGTDRPRWGVFNPPGWAQRPNKTPEMPPRRMRAPQRRDVEVGFPDEYPRCWPAEVDVWNRLKRWTGKKD